MCDNVSVFHAVEREREREKIKKKKAEKKSSNSNGSYEGLHYYLGYKTKYLLREGNKMLYIRARRKTLNSR